MISRYLIALIVAPGFMTGCITEFTPVIGEKTNMLVVEGMVTDQNRTNKIRISRSVPVGKKIIPVPLKGCEVRITDECGTDYDLTEVFAGTYATDSTKFRGRPGGIYTLTINTGSLTYVSDPMEMIPVPGIDDLYYKKTVTGESEETEAGEGCQIYLNTYDPSGKCLFYRWDFTETWEMRLHFVGLNSLCWITEKSDDIYIRNTQGYSESRITKYPVCFVSNGTDRLSVKYSLLVNQYSLNEDEYAFWDELRSLSDNIGGIFNTTPVFIPGNIHNINDPDEVVLGYFSVSAVSQKRIFIKDKFEGLPELYWYCPHDTVWGDVTIDKLNEEVWVLEDHKPPDMYVGDVWVRWRVTTIHRECADCTTRGSKIKPLYWDQETLF